MNPNATPQLLCALCDAPLVRRAAAVRNHVNRKHATQPLGMRIDTVNATFDGRTMKDGKPIDRPTADAR